ncbi:MAG: GNAT family N-acetyltransferase [Gammaproteobacteria bacterium]
MKPAQAGDLDAAVTTARILRSRDAIEPAVREWTRRHADRLSDLSASPEWSLIAADTAGLGGQVSLAAVYGPADALAATAVFVESTARMCGVKVRIRELPGNRVMAYHHELPGEHRIALLRALAGTHDAPCDLLLVPAVERAGPTDAATAAFAAERRARVERVPGVRSPYIVIRGTWEEFLAGRSANFRQDLKRKRKALEALGELTERWFSRQDEVGELLECVHRVEGASWKVEAGMAISRSAQESRYYAALLPWLARIDALVANVLFVAATPVAYSLCYRWRGRIAQMKTSFDERLSTATPGLTVNAAAIRYAFESRAMEFDFLGDVMPHKMRWTDQVRSHDNLYVFLPTPKGRWVGRLKSLIRRLRPHRPVATVGRGGRR